MRLRNFTDHKIDVLLQHWTFRDGSTTTTPAGEIKIALPYEPGDWTEEIDPEDPLVKRLMESGLRPVKMPAWWEKLLRDPPF